MIKASTGNKKASLMPCTPLDLPLTDGIDAGDVIDALDAVLIALVNGIDAHKAGASLGTGGFAPPIALHTGRVLVKFLRWA
ncbi:hypothetical protein [Accumulibacter sp.]|uniref:hypothetical protein n=1 Tax=Accumulibacter sp. TaxID=2053492 RepID=UPI0025855B1F|nr:hypothetical protein [Accumulibacter sp.]